MRKACFGLLLAGLAVACTPQPPATPVAVAPPEAAPEPEAGPTFVDQGIASWYGSELAGNPTASGEPFDPEAMTAAHPELPFGTEVTVTNLGNGQQVTVTVNDRGPFVEDRIIDLSEAAARRLGFVDDGTAQVKIEAAPGEEA